MVSIQLDCSDKNIVLSRGHIGELIAQGRQIIIVDEKVLRVDSWIKYHPGGQKTIEHLVGKDATDEVTASVTLPPRRWTCMPC